MQTSSPAPPESLSGLIERVTFFNEENGFTVLKVKTKGHRDEVTVVGSLPSANPGEWVTAEGRWTNDRQFGLQFRADVINSTAPTTEEGIERYLGSGLVKGIGPIYAKKLVERFGEKIFDIIENYSARLQEVEGIGPKRRQVIKAAWAEQKIIRDIMVFLHSNGVSTSRAVRIYKTYGEAAIERVRSDPYALARDIPGIGFKTADQIAQKIGIPHDSLLRSCAGLEYVLQLAMADGHCALPLQYLKEETGKLLVVEEPLIESALDRSLHSRFVVREEIDGELYIFLPALRRAEIGISGVLRNLSRPPAYPPIDFEKAVAWCESRTGKALAPSQRAALQTILTSNMAVLTGGPGVGKTTLVNAVLKILSAKRVRCLLCAPTGRAAKRLSETTGVEAKTIHRMLEVDPGRGVFTRNESRPLECDLLIIDEMSMVDVPLMHAVCRALPRAASLLLVGDADQLPSVGPGMVLRDIIESGVCPVVRLTEVFRQAAHSRIITNAHLINQGLVPELPERDEHSDFYFVDREEPVRAIATLLELVSERIPVKFKLDPLRDIQVLAPMHRGSLGVRELNVALQAALNPPHPSKASIEKFGWVFRVGDKVIQSENDYDKQVFNGDIGQVTAINVDERELRVTFDGKETAYTFGELDELQPAFAITIHKAQGSEFPAVIVPLATQHYLLLQRNLVYTAVTRGKKLVMIIGQRKALAMAVRNNRTEQRFSGLLSRLRGVVPNS